MSRRSFRLWRLASMAADCARRRPSRVFGQGLRHAAFHHRQIADHQIAKPTTKPANTRETTHKTMW
jgi:hypothetical protein